MSQPEGNPIIEVKHISKKYQIGVDRTYKTLSETLTDGLRHPIRSLRNIGMMGAKECFWALRDINFEVQRGEVIGIIGRNGAGKSTLLKILSRITYPTEGEIVMRGRVGSLLEVGTGFHPELTGRENIYFNGAILGMKKREIDDKFDDIVSFSGIGTFLDTPVKRYSSGMMVRLAFSVAAHLDPEILLVDEVLAVGDAEFQKKCLGKMREVAGEGRTVLFVSHNLGAIQTLCQKVIHLDHGRLISIGESKDEISHYLASYKHPVHSTLCGPIEIGKKLQVEKFEIEPNPLISGDKAHFSITLYSKSKLTVDALALLIYSSQAFRVAKVDLRSSGNYIFDGTNRKEITGTIKSLPLVPNTYNIGLYYKYEFEEGNLFDIAELEIYLNKSNQLVPYSPKVMGIVYLDFDFEVKNCI